MNPLAIPLALSVALNLWFGSAYLGQRDEAVTHQVREQQAAGVAQACSNGTEEIEKKATERKAAAAPKIEAAKKKAEEHNRKADRIMVTLPAVPGNACASAQAELDEWWAGRVKP